MLSQLTLVKLSRARFVFVWSICFARQRAEVVGNRDHVAFRIADEPYSLQRHFQSYGFDLYLCRCQRERPRRAYALVFPEKFIALAINSSKQPVFQPAISLVPLIPCFGLPLLINA